MFVRCLRSMFHLALLGGVVFALSGCGQKGPLYLTDEQGQDPQPLEVSEQELQELQKEEALESVTPQRTTDKGLKSQTYDGSLFPSPRR